MAMHYGSGGRGKVVGRGGGGGYASIEIQVYWNVLCSLQYVRFLDKLLLLHIFMIVLRQCNSYICDDFDRDFSRRHIMLARRQ